MLANRFCQDFLEFLFGCQRGDLFPRSLRLIQGVRREGTSAGTPQHGRAVSASRCHDANAAVDDAIQWRCVWSKPDFCQASRVLARRLPPVSKRLQVMHGSQWATAPHRQKYPSNGHCAQPKTRTRIFNCICGKLPARLIWRQ